jgi:hypothetical protein
MQQSVTVSRNAKNEDDFKPTLSPSGPMAHQFDCFHGNEPIAQIMIQLIGCRINARRTQVDLMRTH